MNYRVKRISHCEVLHMQDIGHGLPSEESFSKVDAFLASVLNKCLPAKYKKFRYWPSGSYSLFTFFNAHPTWSRTNGSISFPAS